jgi:hypothetical protein
MGKERWQEIRDSGLCSARDETSCGSGCRMVARGSSYHRVARITGVSHQHLPDMSYKCALHTDLHTSRAASWNVVCFLLC